MINDARMSFVQNNKNRLRSIIAEYVVANKSVLKRAHGNNMVIYTKFLAACFKRILQPKCGNFALYYMCKLLIRSKILELWIFIDNALPAKTMEYLESTMETLVFDILFCCTWRGSNLKQLLWL